LRRSVVVDYTLSALVRRGRCPRIGMTTRGVGTSANEPCAAGRPRSAGTRRARRPVSPAQRVRSIGRD